MTTFRLATALAIAAVSTAFLVPAAQAQEATPDYPQPITSSLTRAQVQAELAQARRDGSMRVWSTSYNHMAALKAVKTRDQVRAELLADRGESAALAGEDSGSLAMARRALPVPAATVAAAR